MSTDGEVTLGELFRGLERFRSDVNSQLVAVNRRLDNLEYVPREVYNADMNALREDVRELKEAKKWIFRTIVGAFLLPVAVAVVIAVVVTR